MEYGHIIETRKYKYGPQQKLKNLEEARHYVERLRGKIITKLAIEGFWETLEDITKEETEDMIMIQVKIRYPIRVIED